MNSMYKQSEHQQALIHLLRELSSPKGNPHVYTAITTSPSLWISKFSNDNANIIDISSVS